MQLWSDGFYATPKLHWDRDTLTGRPFFYYAYGAAVAEVIVDTLTGEWKLLRADLWHEAGDSINPAIDLGQVEGGFIQGMGWLTTEELWWDEQGRLLTNLPDNYKIPTCTDVPEKFTTRIWKSGENTGHTIYGSKAVGEAPLMLALSVYSALAQAVAAARPGGTIPPLDTPLTPERILMAINHP